MLGKVSLEEAYELPAEADSSRAQAALYIALNDGQPSPSNLLSPAEDTRFAPTNHFLDDIETILLSSLDYFIDAAA